jgi:hypothetical protein
VASAALLGKKEDPFPMLTNSLYHSQNRTPPLPSVREREREREREKERQTYRERNPCQNDTVFTFASDIDDQSSMTLKPQEQCLHLLISWVSKVSCSSTISKGRKVNTFVVERNNFDSKG